MTSTTGPSSSTTPKNNPTTTTTTTPSGPPRPAPAPDRDHHDPISDDSSNALLYLLKTHELEQFYIKLRDELQITRPSHLIYASPPDLTSIGLSSPAALRLIQGAKKERNRIKRKKLTKLLTGGGSGGSGGSGLGSSFTSKSKHPLIDSKYGNHSSVSDTNSLTSSLITCLIQEKDLNIPQNVPPLGTGSFGIVLRGTWNCPTSATGGGFSIMKTQLPVAVKLLKQDALKSPSILTEFITEVQAMAELRHPNLIRLYGIVLGNPMMMVTELAELGNLLDYIRKERITIMDIFPWALQITSAMHYLESNRRLHRDLACRNIFMISLTHVKLGDFGLLRSIPQEQDYYLMTERSKVPFPWCAPESLKYRRWEVGSDAWSWAVTLWELFTFGEEPWIGLNGTEILAKIESGERMRKPEACSTVLWKTLLQCWLPAPSNRPRFKSLLDVLTATYPQVLLATVDFTGDNKLSLLAGDKIAIIDGKPENYYWRGQNLRTFDIGYFPRSGTSPLRPRSSTDISAPLRNSFIHTGHGAGAGGNGEDSWGNPSYIDEVYLRNPMEPEELYADINPKESTKSGVAAPSLHHPPAAQFKYSKFQNTNSLEKQRKNYSHSHSDHHKSAPHRPPPPKNLSDVGVLIDFEGEEIVRNLPPVPQAFYYNFPDRGSGPDQRTQFYSNSESQQESYYANVNQQENQFQISSHSQRQELSSINYPMEQLQEYQTNQNFSNPGDPGSGSDKYNYSTGTGGSFSSYYEEQEGNYEYDPFDTSKILAAAEAIGSAPRDQYDSQEQQQLPQSGIESSSRYYSTVPMMSPPNATKSQPLPSQGSVSVSTPIIQEIPKFHQSPKLQSPLAPTVAPLPDPSPPVPKPSLEYIKKRNEAFEWLDMAMGGIHVSPPGETTKCRNASGGPSSGASPIDRKNSSPNQFENNFSEQLRLPPITHMQNPQNFQSGKLDSGDEIWMNGFLPSNFNKSNSQVQIPLIPPPPRPGPGCSIIKNNFSTIPKSPGKISNHKNHQSNNLLSGGTGTGSMSMLNRTDNENERKIRELESLGLGIPRSKLEQSLIQAAWNIEVAAGRLLDESI